PPTHFTHSLHPPTHHTPARLTPCVSASSPRRKAVLGMGIRPRPGSARGTRALGSSRNGGRYSAREELLQRVALGEAVGAVGLIAHFCGWVDAETPEDRRGQVGWSDRIGSGVGADAVASA